MLMNFKDFDKPLQGYQLMKTNSDLVKTILKIYTMESFIVYKMNEASRNQDINMIPFYGPYATALCFIIGVSYT